MQKNAAVKMRKTAPGKKKLRVANGVGRYKKKAKVT
jgi:hypothetical protein